jgi:hypothetical protein
VGSRGFLQWFSGAQKKILVCFFFFSITTHHHHHGLLHVGARSLRVAKQAQTLLLLLKGLVHAWGCSCLSRGEQKEKVLMVGAGGIGCELLKTLVLTGFKHIHLVRFFAALLLYSLSLSLFLGIAFTNSSCVAAAFLSLQTLQFLSANPFLSQTLTSFCTSSSTIDLLETWEEETCASGKTICAIVSFLQLKWQSEAKQNKKVSSFSVFLCVCVCLSLSPLTLHSLGDLFDEERCRIRPIKCRLFANSFNSTNLCMIFGGKI